MVWPFKKNTTVKKTSKEIQKVSSTQINIKIFSSLGGDIRVQKAEYTATEQRNDFGELVSINTKFNHDQDVNFYMDSIYREMQILLDFRSKTKQEQKDILEKRIQKQEKLIFFLDRVPELNAFYNYQDEWGKLRDYRVLRRHMKLDDQGSYFYINGGVRTYEFDAIDGFLIPRWHGNDTYSSYPDHTRTKKIKIQEDVIFQKEMSSRRFDVRLFNFGVIFFIINMVILFGVGFGALYTFNELQEVNGNNIAASTSCLDNTRRLNDEYSLVIERALAHTQVLDKPPTVAGTPTQKLIKDLNPLD